MPQRKEVEALKGSLVKCNVDPEKNCVTMLTKSFSLEPIGNEML